MESKWNKIIRKPITLTMIAIILGFIVAGIILAAAGYPPLKSISVLISGMFGRPKYVSNVIIKSTPIIFTGLGVAFAIKTGLFNIGAEGQYIMGCVAATIAGICLDLPAPLEIICVIGAAVAASGLYAGIIGFLKARKGIHEVITSIMLNWIALYFSNWICNIDYFHKEGTIGTKTVNPSAYTLFLYDWKTSDAGKQWLIAHPFFKDTLLKTDVNAGFIVAVLAAIAITWLLSRTRKGYELRAVGANKSAAAFTGIDVNKNIFHSMVISGALCGLGAGFYITGMSPHCISTLSAFENVGFNGLSVAFIAASSPIGCIFAGLLFGGLLYGGASLQSQVGAPTEIINIVIGIIVFFCALSYVIPQLMDRYARKSVRSAAEKNAVQNQKGAGDAE